MVVPLLRVPAMPAPPAIEAAMISGGLRPSCRPGGGQCDVSPGGLELGDAPLWGGARCPGDCAGAPTRSASGGAGAVCWASRELPWGNVADPLDALEVGVLAPKDCVGGAGACQHDAVGHGKLHLA